MGQSRTPILSLLDMTLTTRLLSQHLIGILLLRISLHLSMRGASVALMLLDGVKQFRLHAKRKLCFLPNA